MKGACVGGLGSCASGPIVRVPWVACYPRFSGSGTGAGGRVSPTGDRSLGGLGEMEMGFSETVGTREDGDELRG